ncbi:hypothetical protein NHX12_023241, partial [Muraenolepis orangiensis]
MCIARHQVCSVATRISSVTSVSQAGLDSSPLLGTAALTGRELSRLSPSADRPHTFSLSTAMSNADCKLSQRLPRLPEPVAEFVSGGLLLTTTETSLQSPYQGIIVLSVLWVELQQTGPSIVDQFGLKSPMLDGGPQNVFLHWPPLLLK